MNDKTAKHFNELVYNGFVRYVDENLLVCDVFYGKNHLGDSRINDMYGEVCLSHHVPFGNFGTIIELV